MSYGAGFAAAGRTFQQTQHMKRQQVGGKGGQHACAEPDQLPLHVEPQRPDELQPEKANDKKPLDGHNHHDTMMRDAIAQRNLPGHLGRNIARHAADLGYPNGDHQNGERGEYPGKPPDGGVHTTLMKKKNEDREDQKVKGKSDGEESQCQQKPAVMNKLDPENRASG